MKITRERAERIAKAHACESCGEYTYKKFTIKPASGRLEDELKVTWLANKTCGVCGMEQEIGLDEDGDIVFIG